MTEEIKMVLDEIKSLRNDMDTKISSMDTKISSMDAKISSMDAKISSMDAKILSMDTKILSMDTKITDIQFTLENETNPNIKAIAEGHLDLSRKLDDVLKVENEKEMLIIRVNSLENEVRKLKERIDQIA